MRRTLLYSVVGDCVNCGAVLRCRRVRQSSVACRTIEQWAAGGMPVLPKRGAHGRPPLRSRRVSEIGRRNRHDRHPKRLTRPTRDTTLSGLEGGAARGELLGLARAKGAGSAPRRGVAGGPGPPRIPKGKSSPLYAADDELIPQPPD